MLPGRTQNKSFEMKLLSKNKISTLVGGKLYSLEYGDPRFDQGRALLDGNDVLGFVELARSSMIRCALENTVKRGAVIEEGKKVYYDLNFHNDEKSNRIEVDGCLAEKVKRMIYYGFDLAPVELFMMRICQNADPQTCFDTFDFLSYKELPITERGTFLGYKGIRSNGYSVTGNVKTRVLQGEVDATGHILNRVGDTIQIEREDVCANREEFCGPGLHVGSLDYARGWGARTVIVEVDPRDVVSVPLDCSCQKMRTCQYRVVDNFYAEIMAPLAEVKSEGVVESEYRPSEREEHTQRILSNVGALASEGLDLCSLSEICPSEHFELAKTILREHKWEVADDSNTVYLNK